MEDLVYDFRLRPSTELEIASNKKPTNKSCLIPNPLVLHTGKSTTIYEAEDNVFIIYCASYLSIMSGIGI